MQYGKYIEDLILLWFDDPHFNWEDDPDELDDLSEELRTLINVSGDVEIGDSVYN